MISEESVFKLEESFPQLAAEAFNDAHKKALQAGLSVLISEGDKVYEVFPDGKKILVKNIEPPTYHQQKIYKIK